MASQTLVVPDAPMSRVEANGFYQTPNSMTIKAIRAKLTAADWSLWAYLQMIDPFGDRMVELPTIPEIAANVEISERQVRRSLKKLEDLELYYWEPVVIRGQNLAGKQAKQLCKEKKASKSNWQENKSSQQRKTTDLSSTGQDCPKADKIVQKVTDLSNTGQNCPNQASEPLLHKGSSSPQILQTYSDFIKTLSEEARANFLNFCLEKTKNLKQEVNDIEAWLAHKNAAGQNRWEVYYQKFQQENQKQSQKVDKNMQARLEAREAFKAWKQEIARREREAEEEWKRELLKEKNAKNQQETENCEPKTSQETEEDGSGDDGS